LGYAITLRFDSARGVPPLPQRVISGAQCAWRLLVSIRRPPEFGEREINSPVAIKSLTIASTVSAVISRATIMSEAQM
jgi:hypothetical protein